MYESRRQLGLCGFFWLLTVGASTLAIFGCSVYDPSLVGKSGSGGMGATGGDPTTTGGENPGAGGALGGSAGSSIGGRPDAGASGGGASGRGGGGGGLGGTTSGGGSTKGGSGGVGGGGNTTGAKAGQAGKGGQGGTGSGGQGGAGGQGGSGIPVCGDGVRVGTEACDDGNTSSTDGCSATCGVENGWSCLGNAPSLCGAARCGDSILAGAETCDDGNSVPSDGCSSSCLIEAGHVCTGIPSDCVRVSSMATGGGHACALLSDGRVKCWGRNNVGQLGLGDTSSRGTQLNQMGLNLPAIDLGSGRKAKAIAVGGDHTCALLDNDSVKCWGSGTRGETGHGSVAHTGDNPGEMGNSLPAVNLGTGRTAKAIAAGTHHVCAILDNDTLKCWGANSVGQLGQGHNENIGDDPGRMGDYVSAISLGSGRTAKSLALGQDHTCAILDNATLKCWGGNSFGQLGYGDTSKRGDGFYEMGAYLPTVDLGAGRTALSVAAGEAHTCAILDDNQVKCWGKAFDGELGYGDTQSRGDSSSEMGNSLPVVSLGSGLTATSLSTFYRHTCALLSNNQVKCWGDNLEGALGQGTTSDIGEQSNEMGDHLAAVALGTGRTAVQISAGLSTTCAMLDDLSTKCWGLGLDGQSGHGNSTSSGDGPEEMGDSLPTTPLLQ